MLDTAELDIEQFFGQWLGLVASHVRARVVRMCGSSLLVVFSRSARFSSLGRCCLSLSLLRRGWRAAFLLSSRVCLRAAAAVVVFRAGFCAVVLFVCLFVCFLFVCVLCVFVCLLVLFCFVCLCVECV